MPHRLFIVGAQKCGTTSLHHWLAQHPQCAMSSNKEPHYFSTFPPGGQLKSPKSVVRDRAAYDALFSMSETTKVLGEASPSYFFESESFARIADSFPMAKIIICLRDPLQRAYSHYLMNVVAGIERRTFAEALTGSLAAPGRCWSEQNSLYVPLSLYGQQLRRYETRFPKENVRIVLSRSLAAHPLAEMQRISAFLGVDEGFWGSFNFPRRNQGGEPRSNVLRALLASQRSRRFARLVFPRRIRPFLAIRVLSGRAREMDVSDALRIRLWETFDKEVSEVESFVGKKFPDLRLTQPGGDI